MITTMTMIFFQGDLFAMFLLFIRRCSKVTTAQLDDFN